MKILKIIRRIGLTFDTNIECYFLHFNNFIQPEYQLNRISIPRYSQEFYYKFSSQEFTFDVLIAQSQVNF